MRIEKITKKKQKKNKPCTTCVGLTKEQIDFLDDISKCCGCSGGKKLSRAAIMRVLIGVVMLEELDFTAKTIKNKEQLKEKLIEAFREYK